MPEQRTVIQWLQDLAERNTSDETDETMMRNLLHKVNFPQAVVTCGIAYLEGRGTIDFPPMPIQAAARLILHAHENQDRKGATMALAKEGWFTLASNRQFKEILRLTGEDLRGTRLSLEEAGHMIEAEYAKIDAAQVVNPTEDIQIPVMDELQTEKATTAVTSTGKEEEIDLEEII